MSPLIIKKSLLALSGLAVYGLACATPVDAESTAPAYRFNGVTTYPGLGVVLKNDSNILRLNDADPNKISSRVTILSPSVLFQSKQDANVYSLSYNADLGRYSSSSADNFTDQKVLGQAELGLSSRANLNIEPVFQIGHDDRGSTYATTLVPNIWHSAGLTSSFAYGAEAAMGKTIVDIGMTDRKYQNNRTVTTAYDRKLSNVAATFFWRALPKTSLLVNVKHTGIAYSDPTSVLNGNELYLLAGAKWEATAQTTGEFKVGQLKKKFDKSFPSYSGASWEGIVRWSPLSFVNVDFITYKQPVETTLTGSSAIMVGSSGADVSYRLNEQLTLHTNGYQLKEDFIGAGRNDSTNTFGFKAEYKIRSWLIGGAEYTHSAKTSTNPLNDYKRNIIMLSVHSVL